MLKLIAPALLAFVAASNVSFAADSATKEGKPLTPQQEKMRDCNAEAKESGLKGSERKVFMKECLKNEGSASVEKPKGGKASGAGSP